MNHQWGSDAQEFVPERWLGPEAEKLRENLIAFSAGSRNCIGKDFGASHLPLKNTLALRKKKKRNPLQNTRRNTYRLTLLWMGKMNTSTALQEMNHLIATLIRTFDFEKVSDPIEAERKGVRSFLFFYLATTVNRFTDMSSILLASYSCDSKDKLHHARHPWCIQCSYPSAELDRLDFAAFFCCLEGSTDDQMYSCTIGRKISKKKAERKKGAKKGERKERSKGADRER
jgi:hypothetical protein